ncbi:DUF2785 domain-containing protein [Parvularcula lutaonensis]|uniref:DUF2785 domain-containing protein n=1 Tax=Parvularcula lutaonensis TaxID=491923 RepID=A0ABV7M913_9PROT|nr:DUF2785 domain-containing protein [Parvularcula lutaonensis]GGY41163.1 hypothetical protein GCM10007148_07180 [Parvularcula lutaonensis]
MLSFLAALAASCSPLGLDRDGLEALRNAEFAIESAEERDAFLFDLADCAGEPDPFLRDRIGYEGMATILRSGDVSEETVRELYGQYTELLRILPRYLDRGTRKKNRGLRPSFLTLYFTEIVRVDRIEPFLTDEELADLVDLTEFVIYNVNDFRGFDDEQGWRHHLAHASDLAMQLGLNPRVTDEQRLELIKVLTGKIQPPGKVFFRFGEPERVARAVAYLYLGSEIEAEAMREAFFSLAEPSGWTWQAAMNSEAGLGRLHNTRAFLNAMIVTLYGSDQPRLVALRKAAVEARRKLP